MFEQRQQQRQCNENDGCEHQPQQELFNQGEGGAIHQ
jgi:hypothetical protein